MKKIFYLSIMLIVSTILNLSCSFNVQKNEHNNVDKIHEISQTVNLLRTEGHFDTVLNDKTTLCENADLSETEYHELCDFIENPSTYINENTRFAEDEDINNDCIDILYSLCTESSIPELTKQMSKISREMSNDFEEKLSIFIEDYNSTARAANLEEIDKRLIKVGLNSIKHKENSRSAATILPWGEVNAYVALSVTAIAGALVYKYCVWPFWAKWAGLATSAASASGMGVMMLIWKDTQQFKYVKNITTALTKTVQSFSTFLNLKYEDKREDFYNSLKEKIEGYISSNPENAFKYKEFLIFLGNEYLAYEDWKSTITSLANYCLADGESAKQIISIISCTTTAAGICAWIFAPLINDTVLPFIKGFIPDWLKISSDTIEVILFL